MIHKMLSEQDYYLILIKYIFVNLFQKTIAFLKNPDRRLPLSCRLVNQKAAQILRLPHLLPGVELIMKLKRTRCRLQFILIAHC